MSITLLPVPKPRVEHDPYFRLALLQVADVFLTGVILVLFVQAAEGNPLARWFTDHGSTGLSVLLGFKLAVVALCWWCQTGVRLMSAVYGLVVANNLFSFYLLAAS